MAGALPTCENCGRLLNRVTGKCPVCDDPKLAGSAPTPPPLADPVPTPPPPARPPTAPTPDPVRAPVTTPRSLWEDPPATKPAPSSSLPVHVPQEPERPPEPTGPRTTAIGFIGGAHAGRRKLDVYVFEGALALLKAGGPDRRRQALNLTRGQVTALDPEAEFLDGNRVQAIDVAESPLAGQMRVVERDGSDRVLTWSRRANRGIDVERVLHEAFPGKVDIEHPRLPPGLTRILVIGVAVIAAAALIRVGLGIVFKEEEPPPPPPPPTTTLSPQQQQIQAEMAQACPAWRDLFGNLPPGERPDPARLKAVTTQMRPRLDAVAGVDPAYNPARDELAFLEGLAAKPPEELAKESIARIDFSSDAVTAACDRARA